MTNYALVSVPVMVVAFVRPLQCLHQPDIRRDRVPGRDMGVMCLWGTLRNMGGDESDELRPIKKTGE